MRRRTIVAALGGVATAWPFLAQGQERPVVGWLSYFGATDATSAREALLRGLADRGFMAARNFSLVERYGEESIERVDAAVNEFKFIPVNVIVTYGPTVKRVLDAGLRTPVVFAFSGDAVDAGFSSNLSRPDRNATGIAYLAADLNAKRIEMLKAFLPDSRRIGILSNPLHPGEQREIAVARAAAAKVGVELNYLPARDTPAIEAVLGGSALEQVDALFVLSDILTISNRLLILQIAARHRIPVVSGHGAFARSGCLFSYGPDLADVFQRLSVPVDRIIKGAMPADLPIQQPTKFELVVNLKTAKALGLIIPPSILARADEVIE